MKKFLTKCFRWIKDHKLLSIAIGASIAGHCLDIVSTELVMAYVPGSTEGNPLLRDPFTFKFLLGRALEIKGFYFTELALLSVIGYATGWEIIAAAPWLIDAYMIFDVAWHNFLGLFLGWTKWLIR